MLNAVPLNAALNEEFINLLDKLSGIMMKHGESFRAKAYQKAQNSIISYPNNINWNAANHRAGENKSDQYSYRRLRYRP